MVSDSIYQVSGGKYSLDIPWRDHGKHICLPVFIHVKANESDFKCKGLRRMETNALTVVLVLAAFLLGRLSASVKVVGFRTKLQEKDDRTFQSPFRW
jgi:hypothetical protein